MKPRGWRTTLGYNLYWKLRVWRSDLEVLWEDAKDLMDRWWHGPRVRLADPYDAPTRPGRERLDLHVDQGHPKRMVTNYLREIETMRRVEAYARERWSQP